MQKPQRPPGRVIMDVDGYGMAVLLFTIIALVVVWVVVGLTKL